MSPRSGRPQGDFPGQRPLRRLQVQIAQSRSDGERGGNEGVLLQSHPVRRRRPRSTERFSPVGEEERAAALPEAGLHDEGRALRPRPVTPGH